MPARMAAALALAALPALAVAAADSRDPPMSADPACMIRHCSGKLARAMVSPMFYKQSRCSMGCFDFYYNDTTPDKLTYQNCTTKCALTYSSPAADAFLGCAMANNCVTFAPLSVTCPVPDVDPEASLADLSGEWWQYYGKNKLWDCYDCQHIHEMKIVNDSAWCSQTVGPHGPVAAPCFSYTYSYDLYTETGTRYFQQTWQLPGDIPRGKPIDIFYNYMGSLHNETWYLLKATPRFVVLVDCSYMNTWTNVGSIVWVRPGVVLTDEETGEIQQVYQQKKLSWSFPDDFCVDKHGAGCSNSSLAPISQRSSIVEDVAQQEYFVSI